MARVDENVAKLAATCDTGDADDVAKSFEAIELPAMVVKTVATAVVTIDANVLVDAVVSVVDGVGDVVLRINFTLFGCQKWRSAFQNYFLWWFQNFVRWLIDIYRGNSVAIVVVDVVLIIDGDIGMYG